MHRYIWYLVLGSSTATYIVCPCAVYGQFITDTSSFLPSRVESIRIDGSISVSGFHFSVLCSVFRSPVVGSLSLSGPVLACKLDDSVVIFCLTAQITI